MANVYADNAKNRKLGRAGMPRGSMPVSADGTYSPAKTYVDNSFNRRHGRVGLQHGSMVVTKENDSVNRLGRKYSTGAIPKCTNRSHTFFDSGKGVSQTFNNSGIGVSRIFNDSGIGASRIFNDSGIGVSRIFNDSGIDVSHTLNDGGIDESHHSPDTYYSSIRSSTNLHLKVIVQIILESYSHTSRYKLYIETPCFLLVLQFTSPPL